MEEKHLNVLWQYLLFHLPFLFDSRNLRSLPCIVLVFRPERKKKFHFLRWNYRKLIASFDLMCSYFSNRLSDNLSESGRRASWWRRRTRSGRGTLQTQNLRSSELKIQWNLWNVVFVIKFQWVCSYGRACSFRSK